MKKKMVLRVFVVMVLCGFLFGCDTGLEIVGMEIDGYPDKYKNPGKR